MQIGKRDFSKQNHTYVMGILNVTPDSFSDGGKYNQLDQALFHVEDMIAEGMDILDIGGESTRPGYEKISDETEIERVLPVIEAVKKRFDVPVSLDTYKSAVAHAGIQAGVDLINDIWGLKADPAMASVIAQGQVACCLMHNREEAVYTDFTKEVIADLQECCDLAKQAGIAKDRIVLDPGVGFGKTYEHNLQAIRELEQWKALGYPLLLGTSRKSVIGLTLQNQAAERDLGTAITTALAVQAGCLFVRVHNIKANVEAIQMMEAVLYG